MLLIIVSYFSSVQICDIDMDQSIENSWAQVQGDPRHSNDRSILETHNPFPDHSDLQSTRVPSFSSPASVIEPCNPGSLHRRHGRGKSVLQTQLPNANRPRILPNMKWRIRRKGAIANDDSNSNPRDFRQPPSSSLFFPQLGSSSHSNDDRKEDLEENTLEYDQSLEKIDIDPNFGNVSLIPRFVMDPFHAIVIHETEEESVYEVPFELEGDDNDCENAEWEEAVYTDDELTFDDDASDVGSMVSSI